MANRYLKIILFSMTFVLLTVGCGGGSESPTATQDTSNSTSQAVTQTKPDVSTSLPEPKSDPGTQSSTVMPEESGAIVSQTPDSALSADTEGKQPESDVTSDVTSDVAGNVVSDNNNSDGVDECLTDADSKTGFCVDGKSSMPEASTGFDQEECQNASGPKLEQCMDEAKKLIEADPTVCDAATGMMAYACDSPSQSSQGPTEDAGEHQNPCASLPAGDKEKCEESLKNNPFAKPTQDPNNTGKADPDVRLPTDEMDYTNVYVESFDPNNLPKVANANFTELDKFSRMSKIRSGVGHDFSYNTPEYDQTHSNCKSMKHYFMPVGVPRNNSAYAHTPHTFQWMSIKFFSPVDGRIVGVYQSENEYGPEANFTVASSEYPGYFFMFFHIAMNPALKEGSVVEAGQQVGTLGSEEAWGEIAVSAKIGPDDHRLLSFLQVATDDVLQGYTARGVESSSDVIIAKEQRDSNPLPCDDSEAGWFIGTSKAGTENIEFVTWVFESTDNWFFFDE